MRSRFGSVNSRLIAFGSTDMNALGLEIFEMFSPDTEMHLVVTVTSQSSLSPLDESKSSLTTRQYNEHKLNWASDGPLNRSLNWPLTRFATVADRGLSSLRGGRGRGGVGEGDAGEGRLHVAPVVPRYHITSTSGQVPAELSKTVKTIELLKLAS